MRKCVRCGKKGLFLKLDDQKRCVHCSISSLDNNAATTARRIISDENRIAAAEEKINSLEQKIVDMEKSIIDLSRQMSIVQEGDFVGFK